MPSHYPERPRRRRRRMSRATRKALKLGLIVCGVLLILAAGVVGVAAYFNGPPDPRLVGTWQSDVEGTIADRKKTQTITEVQEHWMRQIFGKLKVTYAARNVTVDYGDGTVDTQPYRVVDKNAESVTVSWYFQPSKQDELFLIVFEPPDVYWLDVPGFQMRECFRRVK